MKGDSYSQYKVTFTGAPWGLSTKKEYEDYLNTIKEIKEFYESLAVADAFIDEQSKKYKFEQDSEDWIVDVNRDYYCFNLENSLPHSLRINLITNLEVSYKAFRQLGTSCNEDKINRFKKNVENQINQYLEKNEIPLILKDFYISKHESYHIATSCIGSIIEFVCNKNINKEKMQLIEKEYSDEIMRIYIDAFKEIIVS